MISSSLRAPASNAAFDCLVSRSAREQKQERYFCFFAFLFMRSLMTRARVTAPRAQCCGLFSSSFFCSARSQYTVIRPRTESVISRSFVDCADLGIVSGGVRD